MSQVKKCTCLSEIWNHLRIFWRNLLTSCLRQSVRIKSAVFFETGVLLLYNCLATRHSWYVLSSNIWWPSLTRQFSNISPSCFPVTVYFSQTFAEIQSLTWRSAAWSLFRWDSLFWRRPGRVQECSKTSSTYGDVSLEKPCAAVCNRWQYQQMQFGKKLTVRNPFGRWHSGL